MNFACQWRRALKREFERQVREPTAPAYKPQRWVPSAVSRKSSPNRGRTCQREARTCRSRFEGAKSDAKRKSTSQSPKVSWWFGNYIPSSDAESDVQQSFGDVNCGSFYNKKSHPLVRDVSVDGFSEVAMDGTMTASRMQVGSPCEGSMTCRHCMTCRDPDAETLQARPTPACRKRLVQGIADNEGSSKEEEEDEEDQEEDDRTCQKKNAPFSSYRRMSSDFLNTRDATHNKSYTFINPQNKTTADQVTVQNRDNHYWSPTRSPCAYATGIDCSQTHSKNVTKDTVHFDDNEPLPPYARGVTEGLHPSSPKLGRNTHSPLSQYTLSDTTRQFKNTEKMDYKAVGNPRLAESIHNNHYCPRDTKVDRCFAPLLSSYGTAHTCHSPREQAREPYNSDTVARKLIKKYLPTMDSSTDFARFSKPQQHHPFSNSRTFDEKFEQFQRPINYNDEYYPCQQNPQSFKGHCLDREKFSPMGNVNQKVFSDSPSDSLYKNGQPGRRGLTTGGNVTRQPDNYKCPYYHHHHHHHSQCLPVSACSDPECQSKCQTSHYYLKDDCCPSYCASVNSVDDKSRPVLEGFQHQRDKKLCSCNFCKSMSSHPLSAKDHGFTRVGQSQMSTLVSSSATDDSHFRDYNMLSSTTMDDPMKRSGASSERHSLAAGGKGLHPGSKSNSSHFWDPESCEDIMQDNCDSAKLLNKNVCDRLSTQAPRKGQSSVCNKSRPSQVGRSPSQKTHAGNTVTRGSITFSQYPRALKSSETTHMVDDWHIEKTDEEPFRSWRVPKCKDASNSHQALKSRRPSQSGAEHNLQTQDRSESHKVDTLPMVHTKHHRSSREEMSDKRKDAVQDTSHHIRSPNDNMDTRARSRSVDQALQEHTCSQKRQSPTMGSKSSPIVNRENRPFWASERVMNEPRPQSEDDWLGRHVSLMTDCSQEKNDNAKSRMKRIIDKSKALKMSLQGMHMDFGNIEERLDKVREMQRTYLYHADEAIRLAKEKNDQIQRHQEARRKVLLAAGKGSRNKSENATTDTDAEDDDDDEDDNAGGLTGRSHQPETLARLGHGVSRGRGGRLREIHENDTDSGGGRIGPNAVAERTCENACMLKEELTSNHHFSKQCAYNPSSNAQKAAQEHSQLPYCYSCCNCGYKWRPSGNEDCAAAVGPLGASYTNRNNCSRKFSFTSGTESEGNSKADARVTQRADYEYHHDMGSKDGLYEKDRRLSSGNGNVKCDMMPSDYETDTEFDIAQGRPCQCHMARMHGIKRKDDDDEYFGCACNRERRYCCENDRNSGEHCKSRHESNPGSRNLNQGHASMSNVYADIAESEYWQYLIEQYCGKKYRSGEKGTSNQNNPCMYSKDNSKELLSTSDTDSETRIDSYRASGKTTRSSLNDSRRLDIGVQTNLEMPSGFEISSGITSASDSDCGIEGQVRNEEGDCVTSGREKTVWRGSAPGGGTKHTCCKGGDLTRGMRRCKNNVQNRNAAGIEGPAGNKARAAETRARSTSKDRPQPQRDSMKSSCQDSGVWQESTDEHCSEDGASPVRLRRPPGHSSGKNQTAPTRRFDLPMTNCKRHARRFSAGHIDYSPVVRDCCREKTYRHVGDKVRANDSGCETDASAENVFSPVRRQRGESQRHVMVV